LTEPAVVIDASTRVKRARAKRALYPRGTWFVIRDARAAQVVWYALDQWDLDAELADLDDGLQLGEAINLECYRADVLKAWDPENRRSREAPAVVLDGTEVVGIVPGRTKAVIPGVYRDWMPALRDVDAALLPSEAFFAWPSVTAPSAALPGEGIVLTIVLSQQEQATVLIRVPLSPGEKELDLDIDIAAIGFDAPAGWQHTLRVCAEQRLHSISVPLRVRDDARLGLALVHVAFLSGGMVCGNTTCTIAIGPGDSAPACGESSPCVLPGIDEEPADLVVRIKKADGDSSTGRYVWSMTSTRAAIDRRPFSIDLGDDARTFARSLMHDVVDSDGSALLEPVLNAIGKEIAAHVPPEFWKALRAVAGVAPEGRPPSVLLYSAEEFVPWELAFMDEPLFDGPPHLAAQAIVGRWLHSQSGVVPARPPSTISPQDVAVLSPDYQTRSRPRLERALAEASYMVETHGAIEVNATEDEVRRLLDAELARSDGSPAEIGVVHFAGHAAADPTRPGSAGLFLVNGKRLSPRVFAASMLGRRFGPLLFINACEAGMPQRLLDDNAGFAGTSLRGGFRGFIAPLWIVADTSAGEVARRFYDATLGDVPQPVGGVLRDIRRSANANRDATLLSYVYYGHPHLFLRPGAKGVM